MVMRTVSVDFGKKIGKIKPLMGSIGGPMFGIDLSCDLTDVYRELNIPAVRVSDVEPPFGSGRFLDIHNIFPDPDLDERFPESYNFAPTDAYLSAVKASGAEIYLRLGESRDPYELKRHLRPHTSYEKWARICEKIIAHYNKGWGSGFKFGIKYVEVWSGADTPFGWSGTQEEYFAFYRTVAMHLKEKFPRLRIGAYSSGGFFSLNHFDGTQEQKGYVDFLDAFLSYVSNKATSAPIDFLSWECRAESPEELSLHSNYARSYLSQYGLRRTESIVSAFSLATAPDSEQYNRRGYPAELASALIIAEKSGIDMMFCDSLDPRSGKNAVFSLDDRRTVHKYSAYEVMRAYGLLYSLATAVETTDDYRREIYSLAAASQSEGALLIVTREFSGNIELSIKNSQFVSYSIKGMIGGGERGTGFSTSEESIAIGTGRFTLKVGKNEVYIITFYS